MFGLKQRYIDLIVEVFRNYTEVEQAVIFGSRAMGNYKNGSDIDIAIKGYTIDSKITSKISDELNEESQMPYFFDVVQYSNITNENLLEHIDRVGKVFYSQLPIEISVE